MMKKVINILIILLLLCGCQKREDYFVLSVDGYSVAPGYDNLDYLDVVFDYNIKNSLQANEEIKNIDMYLLGDNFGVMDIINYEDKEIESSQAIISSLTIYLNDFTNRFFYLDGIKLDSSIKSNCDRFNGTYIEKNGYACVIEKNIKDKLCVCKLHGDYLNINQDELDHIIVYVK